MILDEVVLYLLDCGGDIYQGHRGSFELLKRDHVNNMSFPTVFSKQNYSRPNLMHGVETNYGK